MPIVVNSNASATEASFNLTRANDALRKSLSRLSSGKRINSPADDAGGLAVAYKLNSKLNRTQATIQNAQNALSYLQVQDGALETVGRILDRMAELRTMAQDVTKNTQDIENYSKEFIELQDQLGQIKEEKFNGISLFSAGTPTASTIPSLNLASNDLSVNGVLFNRLGRTLYTHPDGDTALGSVSLNVVNLEYVLYIGSLDDAYKSTWGGTVANSLHLGNVGGAGTANATATANDGVNEDGYVENILGVSMGQFTAVIERLADVRAENGAEQNRVLQNLDLLQTNMANLEAAHGRIMDADIALESTRFARHNILVQASASMTAQANQMTNVALALLS